MRDKNTREESTPNKNTTKPQAQPQALPTTTPPPELPYLTPLACLPEFSIFRNDKRFRLFFELVKNAPGFYRKEVIDNEAVELRPYQGVFKTILFARRLRFSRITIQGHMRILRRHKFITTILKHQHSIYCLTSKGVKQFWPEDRKHHESQDGHSTVSHPEAQRTTQVIYQISLNKRDLIELQGRVLKNSPCSGLDLGLSGKVQSWLAAGVCVANRKLNQGDCKQAREFCLPHLKAIAERLQGRAIRFPQTYLRKTINDYFIERG